MNIDMYKNLLDKFAGVRVLVVGDIYLDENAYGTVTGVSLEAPVQILEVHERRYNPGAAGNAACNAAALGGKTAMIGYVGDDINAGSCGRNSKSGTLTRRASFCTRPRPPTPTANGVRAVSTRPRRKCCAPTRANRLGCPATWKPRSSRTSKRARRMPT
jgi:bifunctional ADP-heptose synthase (sugar kinase/adenylyltransferase)